MRLIYKILLGLILFNAMLLVFDPFFPATESYGISQTNGYEINDMWGIIKNSLAVSGMAFVGIIVLGIIISNAPIGQLMGTGAIISIITGLYAGFSAPFFNLIGKYPAGQIFYDALVICIGIVTAFSMLEIFTFKGDTD